MLTLTLLFPMLVQPSLPELIERLGDAEPEVRERATMGLRAAGSEAIMPLMNALGASDAEVRVRAAALLSERAARIRRDQLSVSTAQEDGKLVIRACNKGLEMLVLSRSRICLRREDGLTISVDDGTDLVALNVGERRDFSIGGVELTCDGVYVLAPTYAFESTGGIEGAWINVRLRPRLLLRSSCTHTYVLAHASAAAIAETIRTVYADDRDAAPIAVDVERDTITVVAPDSWIPAIETILMRLDAPAIAPKTEEGAARIMADAYIDQCLKDFRNTLPVFSGPPLCGQMELVRLCQAYPWLADERRDRLDGIFGMSTYLKRHESPRRKRSGESK